MCNYFSVVCSLHCLRHSKQRDKLKNASKFWSHANSFGSQCKRKVKHGLIRASQICFFRHPYLGHQFDAMERSTLYTSNLSFVKIPFVPNMFKASFRHVATFRLCVAANTLDTSTSCIRAFVPFGVIVRSHRLCLHWRMHIHECSARA